METELFNAVDFLYLKKIFHLSFKEKLGFRQDGTQIYPNYLNGRAEIYSKIISSVFNTETKRHDIKPCNGVLLMGGVGVGKTIVMRTIGVISHLKYKIVRCKHVADKFSLGGHEELMFYSKLKIINQEYQIQSYCFEDLGDEKNRNYFSDKDVNCMAIIIMDCYELFIKYGTLFHFTTNLDEEQLELKYGERVTSRLFKMCNLISFGDLKDLRKRK